MPYINFNEGKAIQVWPGIAGPIHHSEKLTFGFFTLEEGIDLPEHCHPHEQWCNVIEGILEFDINGEKMTLQSGMTALIPSNMPHSGKAITKCKVLDCFSPLREDFRELSES